jgi:hypothetical protein
MYYFTYDCVRNFSICNSNTQKYTSESSCHFPYTTAFQAGIVHEHRFSIVLQTWISLLEVVRLIKYFEQSSKVTGLRSAVTYCIILLYSSCSVVYKGDIVENFIMYKPFVCESPTSQNLYYQS